MEISITATRSAKIKDFAPILKSSVTVTDNVHSGESVEQAGERISKVAQAMAVVELYRARIDDLAINDGGVDSWLAREMERISSDQLLTAELSRVPGSDIEILMEASA